MPVQELTIPLEKVHSNWQHPSEYVCKPVAQLHSIRNLLLHAHPSCNLSTLHDEAGDRLGCEVRVGKSVSWWARSIGLLTWS